MFGKKIREKDTLIRDLFAVLVRVDIRLRDIEHAHNIPGISLAEMFAETGFLDNDKSSAN